MNLQLKTFQSLETDSLSAFHLQLQIFPSMVLNFSPVFGVNKMVTFFQTFPPKVKEIEHFLFI